MSGGDELSRRRFLRGGFLRRDEDEATSSPTGDPPPITSRTPPGHDPSRPVMRYPKTTDDVDAGTGTRPGQRTSGRRCIPVHRPPGAIDEPTFLEQCTRCDECLKACPHDAIIHAPPQLHEIAGTPVIDADRQPCLMCEDLPCIDACEPGVLTHDVPIVMGIARITEETCLAYNGTTCTVCAERCPVEGAIVMEGGRPRVVDDRCTGCGVCRYVCPAPENAVLFMPTFTRPPKPASESSDD